MKRLHAIWILAVVLALGSGYAVPGARTERGGGIQVLLCLSEQPNEQQFSDLNPPLIWEETLTPVPSHYDAPQTTGSSGLPPTNALLHPPLRSSSKPRNSKRTIQYRLNRREHVRHLSKRLPIGPASAGYRKKSIEWIDSRRRQLAGVSDEDLKAVARDAHTLPETFAVTAVLAERLLGFKMFHVQLHCALALADGKIAEMQTGEGKTLSAVPAAVWLARAGKGVHVMTVNDYLARRDAGWMKPILQEAFADKPTPEVVGIVHERIQPGRPQQNGCHERMHRTLKEDTTNPAALTLRLQQRKFDRFRQMYNHERPHEGLNNQTPGSLYHPSSLILPRTLIEYAYPKEF